jgi:hypothetical protein
MAPAGTGSGTIMPFSHHPGWTSSPTRRCRASQSCSSTPPGLDRSIALATEAVPTGRSRNCGQCK